VKLLSVVFTILLVALATNLAARLKRAGALPIGNAPVAEPAAEPNPFQTDYRALETSRTQLN